MKDYNRIKHMRNLNDSLIWERMKRCYDFGYEDGKADTPFTDTEEAEKKAYNRGLADSWNVIKKITRDDSVGGYSIEMMQELPCDDAISRDAALEKMADYVASGYADSAEDFEEYSRIICQLPSVTQKLETVTEFADRCRECGKMRKGHWIWNFDKGYCKCSECGIGMGHKEFDYCPNCGCRMVEPQESERDA